MTPTDGDDEGRSDDVRALWRRDPEAAWAMRRLPTTDGDAEVEALRGAGSPACQPTDSATWRATDTASTGE